MAGLSWFKFYSRDWFLDTRDLSDHAKGAYIDLLAAMYARGGPLPHDDAYLRNMLGYQTIRRMRTVLKELIDKGKISIVDGQLVNNRAQEELEVANRSVEIGKTGGRPPRNNEVCPKDDPNFDQTFPKDEGSIEKNQTLNQNLPESRIQNPDKEEVSHPTEGLQPGQPAEEKFAFQGKVIRLNQADFDRWRVAYSAIPDFAAALESLDDFYSKEPPNKRRKWFIRCSKALENQHQKFLANARAAAKPKTNHPDIRDVVDEPLWLEPDASAQ